MTFTRNHTAVVVLSSLGFGAADLMLPAAWAVCLDIRGRRAGAVTGIMNNRRTIRRLRVRRAVQLSVKGGRQLPAAGMDCCRDGNDRRHPFFAQIDPEGETAVSQL
jgi:hypothetical protein